MDFYYKSIAWVLFCAISTLRAAPSQSDSGGAGSEYDGVVLPVDDRKFDFPEKTTITIVVDEDNPIKVFSKDLFGFNYDWDLTQALMLPDGSTEPDPEVARKLAGINFPLNRVAGSDSKRFRWKGAIGDPGARPPQKLWDWSKGTPVLFGPVEWIRWVQEIDPDATFSWVVNLNESPEDIRDLAEFLCGTPREKADGGQSVDWAARRVELGITEPVNVSIWEIGNEMDIGNEDRRWSVDEYMDAAGPAIDAIRSVDPDAVIAVHSKSSPWAPLRPGQQPWENWHREVLEFLGDDVDLLVFHPYYNGIPLSQVEGYMDVMSADIKAITGDDRIKLYHSEQAVWPPMPPDGNWRNNWFMTHSLGGTLNTALFLTLCINRADTVAAAYHSFHSGPWGLIYRDDDSGELYTTGIAAMFKLFSEIDGSDVLPVRLVVDGHDISQERIRDHLGVAAVKGDHDLQIVVVNRDASPVGFSFESGFEYEICDVKTLGGSDVDLSNTVDKTPLSIKTDSYSNIDKTVEHTNDITLPGLSFNVIRMIRK